MITKYSEPILKKIPNIITIHGHTRIDNYSWLKNEDDPDVKKYLELENEYTFEIMSSTKQLQTSIYNEIVTSLNEDFESVHYTFGNYYYFFKESRNKNHKAYYRKLNAIDSDEELILDVNNLTENLSYCSVNIEISPDENLLCYMVDSSGEYSYTAFFKDLANHSVIDKLNNVCDVKWCNDNNTIYYTYSDNKSKFRKLYKHILGTNQNKDILIYEEIDESYFVFLDKSKTGKYIFVTTGNADTNETYIIDANKPDSELKLFSKRNSGVLYYVDHSGDNFYILTNYLAPNFKVMKTSRDETMSEFWKEFISETEDVKIERFYLFKRYLVLKERNFGISEIRVINLETNSIDYVNFPEKIYTAMPIDNVKFDTNCFRYNYTSYTTPATYIDYDMKNHRNIKLKQKEVLNDYDPSDYISERIYATSQDGKLIPISLVYKKGLNKDGENPLFLQGYGAYGISLEIYFTPDKLSLLNRGFIYATAHVRGGGELGEKWYEEGKLLKKKNTFSDFITCAEYLIENGYTYHKGIVAYGGSAGGLLMGVIANMRPDLFNCIIAEVPALDILNSLIDINSHNSKYHFDEWGDPNIKEYYEYMLSYSPYENITKQEYPNLLITIGFKDPNVRYWEGARFTAKLRELRKNRNYLLLKTNMNVAHMGPSGRYDLYKDIAFEYAFILKCFGINK